MRIGLAQINTTVGDLNGNLQRMRAALIEAGDLGCELVLFPELAVTGYPPKDLLDSPAFVSATADALEKWASGLDTQLPAALIGSVVKRSVKSPGRPLLNAAVLVVDGHCQSVHPKTLLPSYDVFDEDRWFEPRSAAPVLIRLRDGAETIGVTICEDLWLSPLNRHGARYDRDPLAEVVNAGAQIVVNLSASPFAVGKGPLRHQLLCDQALKYGRPILYVNQVGGNDELIFDGCSIVVNASGQIVARGAAFAEDLVVVDMDSLGDPVTVDAMGPEEEVTRALVLGVRDYFSKIGCTRAVVGLSGGIDSALTAAIGAMALGPENVVGITMPSEFSSEGSVRDAEALAGLLGMAFHVVPIQSSLDVMRKTLSPTLGPVPWGVTDENLQARIRGQILMAYSNRHGHLVLSPGNKSELATGYCTLYGDMCGGLAVISDVPKTMVYRVARYLNRDRETIPVATIEKPPSAELRPDQRDDQSLPPYDVLDPILEAYIEDRMDICEIVRAGFEQEVVERVIGLVDRSEYKRRQMPIGLRVTSKAFGSGRRIPIAQRWAH